MKKLILLISLCIPFLTLSSQTDTGLDQRLNEAFDPIATWWENLIFFSIPLGGDLSVPIVLIILIGAASYFTFYFNFVNIKLRIPGLQNQKLQR